MNRLVRGAFLIAVVALIVILFTDITQTQVQRAASAISKCETSVSIGMLNSGAQYCKEGIDLVIGTEGVAGGWLARGYVQLAAVSAQQRRVVDAVRYCQLAIAAWELLKPDVSSYVRDMKTQSTELCRQIVSAKPSVNSEVTPDNALQRTV